MLLQMLREITHNNSARHSTRFRNFSSTAASERIYVTGYVELYWRAPMREASPTKRHTKDSDAEPVSTDPTVCCTKCTRLVFKQQTLSSSGVMEPLEELRTGDLNDAGSRVPAGLLP